MGLDMYLTKHTYVKRWSHDDTDKLHEVSVTKGGKILAHIQPERVSYIIEQIGYWRKANAIHGWFVKNVQDGNDNGEENYVSEDDLKKLLETCQKVLAGSKLVEGVVQRGSELTPETDGKFEPILEKGKIVIDPSVAEELLPTQSGFFFGGTDYDDYYINDLQDTIKIVEDALKDIKYASIYYSASW